MRSLITAIRAVKLYPPNNPIYSQSVAKSYEHLARFLETAPEYPVGVHKTFFTYRDTPFGKDAALNKTIAQDLFAKEVRELVFSEGIIEEELMVLLKALALSSEEMAMKSGISSILWENGVTHIKVVESGLDEVVTTTAEQGWDSKQSSSEADGKSRQKNATLFAGRTLVLGNLMADPEGFGASMLELAKQTREENESVENRLYSLYQEAGQKIRKENPGESDALFEGLAQSVLSLEPHFREGLVAGKLYTDLDSELASDHVFDGEEQVPNMLQEVQAGRFSNAWTVQHVATLLKKTPQKKNASPAAAAPDPATFKVTPIPAEITGKIASDLATYTQEEMAALKAMSGVGMESDIIQAAVRTLIFLIPLVKNPYGPSSEQNDVKLFSGVIRQLEELLGYLQKKKDYELAAVIIRAFHSTVDPVFKPRMTEALKKSASKSAIADMVADMRKRKSESSEYSTAYAYLKTLDRAGTSLLLDLLADEGDRDARLFLITILKDLGKNQLALVGEQLTDGRWYVVRNAVRILGDTGAEQAIAFLHKAADHQDARIREEVIQALNNIGGRKAAGILARYLKDKDQGLQVLALRSMGELQGLGDTEAHYVMDFAELRPLRQREQELTLEAITVLGRIGGRESAEFLARYRKTRWWKPRKLQEELRDAALVAIEAIKRRLADAGRAKR